MDGQWIAECVDKWVGKDKGKGKGKGKGKSKGKGKGIPVTGREGPKGCEKSRLPHYLNNRLADGGVVNLKRRPLFTPRKIPGTHFC
jgi:hypothetical protein